MVSSLCRLLGLVLLLLAHRRSSFTAAFVPRGSLTAASTPRSRSPAPALTTRIPPPSPLKPATPSSLQMVPSVSAVAAALANFYKGWPLLSGFATASAKAAVADRLAQWRDVCTTKFNLRRNVAMVLYSGTVLGVSCEIMYNRLFPLMFGVEQSMARVVKMTLFDGFVNAPLLWLPPAYIVQALIYRYPKRKALEKYAKDVRENGLLTKYWSLWVPVSFINFRFVSPHYRIAFVASVSFFWMIILSVLANKTDQDPESCPVEPEPVLLNPRALD